MLRLKGLRDEGGGEMVWDKLALVISSNTNCFLKN